MNTPQAAQSIDLSKAPEFTVNKYYGAKRELAQDLAQLFSLPALVCYALSEKFISDHIKATSNGQSSVSANKVNKQGEMTLRELTVAKKVAATPALKIGRAVSWANDAMANGVSRGETEWSLAPDLAAYVVDVQSMLESGKLAEYLK